ncbi:MAG: VRR-NUC domain-containing protein [Clostridia bacterium]|nr:VRR-NUC domain-containing protein [Clostridia bacterium]
MLTEDQEQQNLIKWSQQPSVRGKYPELALLYHIPNERKCTPQEGARFKRMGVKPGVPDLHLPVARRGFHSLYIEMKTRSGQATENQKWWAERLGNEKNCWALCRGWQEAVSILEWYLGN